MPLQLHRENPKLQTLNPTPHFRLESSFIFRFLLVFLPASWHPCPPQLTQRGASPSPLVSVAQVHEGVPRGGSVPPDREPPNQKLENGVQLRLVTGEGSGLRGGRARGRYSLRTGLGERFFALAEVSGRVHEHCMHCTEGQSLP